MKIPEKASITLKDAPDIRLGVKRTEYGWQFGIFSEDETLQITLFDKDKPDEYVRIEAGDSFRTGKIFSFVLEINGTMADELDGLCYAVGEERRADIYAFEYCYAAAEEEQDGSEDKISGVSGCSCDDFGRSRNELCSVMRKLDEKYPSAASTMDIISADNRIIYKLHVRGFTKLENGGSFRALAGKVSYIRELGMNAVLLMPCYEFHEYPLAAAGQKNHYGTGYSGRINYWGYTDGYYFAPKRAYCAGDNCVREFTDMVYAFHEKNIAVLMEMWFPQSMAPMTAVDILRHWHIKYGVDGFRIIGSGGLMYAAKTDMQLSDCILIGEDFGGGSFFIGGINEIYDDKKRLIKYDEGFMDAARHFLRGDEDSIKNFLHKLIRHEGGHPTINFMADQNCLSLMDMVSYEHRHNEYNGENNSDGRRYNISFNCGVEGKTRRENILRQRYRMIKNALAMTFLSSSVPMLAAGDEFGMSHGGNNNPYCHDSEINYIDWSLLKKNAELYEFTKSLIKFRNEHKCIRPEHDFSMNDHKIKGMPDLSCHSERAWFPLMAEYSHNIGLLYCGAYAGENKNVYILYNMHNEPHEFAVIDMAGGSWTCVLASDNTGVIYDEGRKKIRLSAHTMAVFVSGGAESTPSV